MNYKLATLVLLVPLLGACGGGSGGTANTPAETPENPEENEGSQDTDDNTGGDDNDDDDNNGGEENSVDDNTSVSACCLQEDRTPPAQGSVITTSSAPIMSNGVDGFPDAGPQSVDTNRPFSFPGLRYGSYLMLNNSFNDSNTRWSDWSQSIVLNDGSPVTAEVTWDWGLESQKFQPFETLAFPELVYGTKSPDERSGTFAQTGLPVEEANRPDISINYSYSRVAGVSDAPLGANDTLAESADSEHNVIIESFWHDSCEIVRNGGPNDNQVMEVLVWFYHGERLPSGPLDIIGNKIIDGAEYTIYRKSSNFNFLAYVATEERQSGTLNYSAFIEDAKANAATYNVYQLTDSDCFANILFGPEEFQGAGSFTINNFEITRSY